MSHLRNLVALALLATACTQAGAAGGQGFVGAPLTELEFVAQYGDSAKKVAPGVYKIEDHGTRKTVAYGLDGLRYRVAELDRLAKDGATSMKDVADDFRSRLESAQRHQASKDYKDIPGYCGYYGYVDAEYSSEPNYASVSAIAEATYDGFGPAPPGPTYVSTKAMRRVYYNGACRWQVVGQTTREVTSLFPGWTSAFDSTSGSGVCSRAVYALASFQGPDMPAECNISVSAP